MRKHPSQRLHLRVCFSLGLVCFDCFDMFTMSKSTNIRNVKSKVTNSDGVADQEAPTLTKEVPTCSATNAMASVTNNGKSAGFVYHE